MGPDTRTRSTTLARCWRGSCYGFGFAASTIFLFIMMWLLWCYVGLVSIPATEPQRRALVHYPVTTPKPGLTTSAVNATVPSQKSTANSIQSAIRPQTTPLRGNSRGEAQIVRKDSTISTRNDDATAKGDFNARDSGGKSSINATAVRPIGTDSSDSAKESRRYNDETIRVRTVSSSAAENQPESKEIDRRSDKPLIDREKTESREYDIDKSRRTPEDLPSREDDYDDNRKRPGRPVDRDFYDDKRPAREYDDYDKGRPPSRDYSDRDRRPIDPKDIRDEPIRKRVDDDRVYERRVDDDRVYERRVDDRDTYDKDRPRYDRDYPRRRYDDVDDKDYDRRRRGDDDLRLRDRDRETTIRRVDDDYYKSRPASTSDDKYREDSYKSSEDRYRDRSEDRYRSRSDDRDDSYKPVDEDTYRRDRYRDDDRYRDRSSDERYRRRDDDRYRDRSVDDDRYKPRIEPVSTARRDDVRPRGDVGPYRDEVESRRSLDVPLVIPPIREPVIDFVSRSSDDIDRKDGTRKYSRDDGIQLPPRSEIEGSRYRDREEDRRRPPPLADDDYRARDKDLPIDPDGYRYREHTRARDDPPPRRRDDPLDDPPPRRRDDPLDDPPPRRRDDPLDKLPPQRRDDPPPRRRDDPLDDVDRRKVRPRYDSDSYRPRSEEDITPDRYRNRRVEDETLPIRDPIPRRDDDYRGSRSSLSKGDERVLDRGSSIYLTEDKELSKTLRTKPEDVVLGTRSYSDDDYIRNRPRTDVKLSSDRDDRDDRYRPPRRRITDPDRDYIDDRYDGRSRDRYDDEYRGKSDYDRTDDRRYTRTDSRDDVRPLRADSVDRIRDIISPSRTIPDDRPIRSSIDRSRDVYPSDTRPYIGDSRTSRVDDEYRRRDSTYTRPPETRLNRDPSDSIPSSRTQTNIREKRYQEQDDPCIDEGDDHSLDVRSNRRRCEKASSSVASNPVRPTNDAERPLTPKEVIEAAYRHRDAPDRPGEAVYPVFDPRVNNMTSPEIIRPNERRGTTITTRKKKK